MDYKGPAPDVRRDRAALGRCQYDQEIGLGAKVQTGSLVDDSLQILILARADRPDERQAAQTCIQMFQTCAKLSGIRAQDQTNFSSLLNKVFDQRGSVRNAPLKSDAKILFI